MSKIIKLYTCVCAVCCVLLDLNETIKLENKNEKKIKYKNYFLSCFRSSVSKGRYGHPHPVVPKTQPPTIFIY